MYNTRAVEENITFEKILKLVDDYYIYCYYLNKVIPINKPMSSPFRRDNHPSWALYRDRKGITRHRDFATGESGNVVDLVRQLENLRYHEALQRIWDDVIVGKHVSLRKATDMLPKSEGENIIGIKKKNYTDNDILFWGQYHITKETLKLYKVFPISTYWVNEIQANFFYTENEPMYAYSIYDKYKIYRPYSRRIEKWRNNCSSFDIQGMEQLADTGDLLIITKSLKDVMVLYELGYNAIAPQSENSSIPKVIMNHLKLRFKKIIIVFDYDDGGIQGSQKLSEKYSIPYTFIPKHYLDLYQIKDVSDFVKEFGKDQTITMLKELLDENTTT